MKKKYFSVLLLVFVSLFAVTAGVVYAKYVRSVEQTGKVTVTADLVDTFELYESQAYPQKNGSYSLDTSSQVTENSYTLLPGLDVPKDPTIVITGKTSIPAYLYIELIDNLDASITYTLTSNWQDISHTGPNGGKIYVYAVDGTPAKLQSFDTMTIGILSENELKVSEKLPRGTHVDLKFYAYMAQAAGGQDAKTVFDNNF